jgi:hypothetical protein
MSGIGKGISEVKEKLREHSSSLTSNPSDLIALMMILLPAGSLVIAGSKKHQFQTTGINSDVNTHSREHLDYALTPRQQPSR